MDLPRMDNPPEPPAPLDLTPIPAAATLWQDTPPLYEHLRSRLASYAPNTQRALANDWRAWRIWCVKNLRTPFPATAADLVDYVMAHSPPLEMDERGTVSMDRDAVGPTIRCASTVQRWLASLSTLHRVADSPDPTRHEDVVAAKRTVLRGRNVPDQKAPLRWVDVEKALATLGDDNLRDIRAKALIAVAYSTLARRAELVDLQLEDVTFGDEGDGTVTLRTKGGHQAERYLAPEARVALEAWLTMAGIKYGAVFRRLEKHGGIGERTINSEEVARTFKRIAGMLDLDASRPPSRISGHSTRIGAAQDLTSAGAALPEIMVAGGWKSPQMPAHYARKLEPRQGAMQRWLAEARNRNTR
jgi:integrase/recombinase XerD